MSSLRRRRLSHEVGGIRGRAAWLGGLREELAGHVLGGASGVPVVDEQKQGVPPAVGPRAVEDPRIVATRGPQRSAPTSGGFDGAFQHCLRQSGVDSREVRVVHGGIAGGEVGEIDDSQWLARVVQHVPLVEIAVDHHGLELGGMKEKTRYSGVNIRREVAEAVIEEPRRKGIEPLRNDGHFGGERAMLGSGGTYPPRHLSPGEPLEARYRRGVERAQQIGKISDEVAPSRWRETAPGPGV